MNMILVLLGLVGLSCVCPPPNTSPSNSKINNGSGNSSANESANSSKSIADENDPLKTGLKVISAKWEKGGFGAVAIWKVTLQNTSKVKLGNIKFRTAYFSETGNKVSSGGVDGLVGKDTIEKLVEPGKKRTFEVNDGFVSDEAHTATFSVVSWEIIN